MSRRDLIEQRVTQATGISYARLIGRATAGLPAPFTTEELVPELVKAVKALYGEVCWLADELDSLENAVGRR